MAALAHFRLELEAELQRILSFWLENARDEKNGGFTGQIDFYGRKNCEAEKGSVLNARILWTFSHAYQLNPETRYGEAAKRAFDYIKTHFYDSENGGIYWSVDAKGRPLDPKNQIYALAFAIYGLSEYHVAFADADALGLAVSLYRAIEKHGLDRDRGGYLEALTQNWQPVEDSRLSEKDANEKKTMNTHLHLAEAYANLYKTWKDDGLKKVVSGLLDLVDAKFINKETGHLRLFFNEDWIEKPDVVSYGHDIEAAWLLLWCAETIEDGVLIETYRKNAVLLAEATKEGIDADGGLWYEFDTGKSKLIAQKHWWPQSEMQLGYFTAWELTRREEYLDIVFKNWEFTKKHLFDTNGGEWFWGVNADYSPVQKDKVGFWKCPYHNSRACMELINRIKKNQYDKAPA